MVISLTSIFLGAYAIYVYVGDANPTTAEIAAGFAIGAFGGTVSILSMMTLLLVEVYNNNDDDNDSY
jgi:uncharacterized membrane protein